PGFPPRAVSIPAFSGGPSAANTDPPRESHSEHGNGDLNPAERQLHEMIAEGAHPLMADP
ncbi:MAG: hypothetical protein KDA21_14650, partial [Phycisphaerales bacterium]|nr:hypothetical protein [Phycisphaerales bacterium]